MKNGHIEIVKHLVRNKANINAKTKELVSYMRRGEGLQVVTPLHVASHGGHLEIVKYLVSISPTFLIAVFIRN